MADMILKLLAAEFTVTTANNLGNAQLFRIHAPSASVVTVKDAGGTTLGSMSMPAGAIETMAKGATDTVEATAAVRCTPVAYR